MDQQNDEHISLFALMYKNLKPSTYTGNYNISEGPPKISEKFLVPLFPIFGGCAMSNEIDEKTTTIALAHHVFFFLCQYLVN